MDDSTDVMSLDELMDLAAAEPTVTMPTAPPPVAAPPVAAPPAAPARSAAPHPQSRPRPERVIMADARQAMVDVRRVSAAGISVSRDWLETNDNALIAATVLVTLLLLIVVAAL